MRAFAVRSFGEPPSVHDLPVPAADGTVLIRVRVAGVNPLDSNLLGRLTAASSYPFVAGIDFAGVAAPARADPRRERAGRVPITLSR
jgi:NADPH:quinone reductase-like Zn-dependent oxidoreductase